MVKMHEVRHKFCTDYGDLDYHSEGQSLRIDIHITIGRWHTIGAQFRKYKDKVSHGESASSS